MQRNSEPQSRFFSPLLHSVIIVILFTSAFALRVYRINEFPANLNVGREYHSIIIARGYYFEKLKSIPDWKRDVAVANKDYRATGEPRIMEHLAAFAYRIAGDEYLWLPRLFSTMFWFVGAAALYKLIRKLFSPDAAILPIAFFLFLPYSVSVSRSLMPHPLMVMTLIFAISAIFRYHQNPDTRNLFFAAFLSALAMLAYPSALFPTFGAFFIPKFASQGLRKTLISPNLFLFALITLLPVAFYYGYNYLFADYLKNHINTSLTPRILLQPFFWRGWFNRVESIIGLPALIAGLFGILMFPGGIPRAFVGGLWLGYLVYALIFNYHNATHEYYQTIFIPIVALSLAPLGTLLTDRLNKTCTNRYWRIPVAAVIILALILNAYSVRLIMYNPTFQQQIKIAQEIGDVIRHSTKTILLTSFYMSPFKYHGELAGEPWPSAGDFTAYRLRGEPIPSAQERFNAQFLKHNPEFFIITDFNELMRQTDLKNFLVQNFSILAQNPNYVIFDLRKPLKPQNAAEK